MGIKNQFYLGENSSFAIRLAATVFFLLVLFLISYFSVNINSIYLEQSVFTSQAINSIFLLFFIVFFSLVASFPLGLLLGIWLSEYLSVHWLKHFIRESLRYLACIPSVFWTVIGLYYLHSSVEPSAFEGSLIFILFLLPITASICDKYFSKIPDSYREAALALGASRFDLVSKIALPMVFGLILRDVLLCVSRVVFEIGVILLVGVAYLQTHLGLNLDSLKFRSLAPAIVLLLISFLLSLFGEIITIQNSKQAQ